MFVPPARFDLRCQCGRRTTILGRASACSASARRLIHRNPQLCSSGLSAISRWASASLIEEGLRRVGQTCIAVRDTHRIDKKKSTSVFRGEAAYRGRIVSLCRPLHSCSCAEYN